MVVHAVPASSVAGQTLFARRAADRAKTVEMLSRVAVAYIAVGRARVVGLVMHAVNTAAMIFHAAQVSTVMG